MSHRGHRVEGEVNTLATAQSVITVAAVREMAYHLNFLQTTSTQFNVYNCHTVYVYNYN